MAGRGHAGFQDLSLAFWDTLVEGSDNLAYRLVFNTLRETYAKVQELLTRALEDEITDVWGYREIAQAVRKGDGTKAAKRATEHIERGTATMMQLLDGVAGLGAPLSNAPAKKRGKR